MRTDLVEKDPMRNNLADEEKATTRIDLEEEVETIKHVCLSLKVFLNVILDMLYIKNHYLHFHT